MPATGVPEVDALYDRADAPPITQASSRAAVGVVWDLLRGRRRHPRVKDAVERTAARWLKAKKPGATPGLAELPLEGSAAYGVLTDPWRAQLTFAAVRAFQGRPPAALEENPAWVVDHDTLARLTAPGGAGHEPLATRVYLTRVAGVEWKDAWILSLVAQHEGRGRFDALNVNTDGAGLSVGLIQWAQSPGRLGELVETIFTSADPAVKAAREAAFGRDPARHALLRDHTKAKTAAGGIFPRDWKKKRKDDPQAGTSRISGQIDLLAPDWLDPFRTALRDPALQRMQVRRALLDFGRDEKAMRKDPALDAAAEASPRMRAFLLDLANQHGAVGKQSKPGALLIFRKAHKAWLALPPGQRTEAELLKRMEEESVTILRHLFPSPRPDVDSPFVAAGRARRRFFRELDESAFPPPEAPILP